MKKRLFLKNIIYVFLIIWIKFSQFSCESISLCQLKSRSIACSSDQNIVILNASLGYLPYLDRQNYNKTSWCRKSDLYYNISSEGCVKSLRGVISSRCTGYNDCKLNVIPSEYITKDDMVCEYYRNKLVEMSLYVDYECVTKELFFSPEQLNEIHYIGGYITSVGYSVIKSQDQEEYSDFMKVYQKENVLPMDIVFRPKLVHERLPLNLFIFQLQLLENSMGLTNGSGASQTCQIGNVNSKDYYTFMPKNNTGTTNEQVHLTICSTNSVSVGQTIGPTFANQINIKVNVNFTSMLKRAFLIKFTTILCPLIVVENAKVVYDHVVYSNQGLTVLGIAIITCNHGFFLHTMSNINRKVFSRTIECNHLTGVWNQFTTLEKCINAMIFTTKSNTVKTSIFVTKIPIPSTNSSISTSSKLSTITITNTSTALLIIPIISTSSSSTYYIVLVVIIFILILIFLSLLLWKFRDKIKCAAPFFNWYSKLRFKNDTIPHTNYLDYHRASMRHNFIFDDNTPMTESLNFNLSANGSCRQSNRTLITRAGSRPTIISADSMQTSNYIFEPDSSDMSQRDELPTKLPKTSTISRIMRSASSLRNNSLGRMRPKSLSRQSFADRGSNLFDNKFSGSQIPLLLSRKPNLTPQFMESNPHIMVTSDISPSRPLPKSAVLLRKNHNHRPYCHSDLLFQTNNTKVISPTIDTYLEPTESFVQPYELSDDPQSSAAKGAKSSDYMVYDHSQVSSNNPDNTCQSSVIASLSDGITNEEEEKKRFSMISNQYYGLQGHYSHHGNCIIPENVNRAQYDVKSNSNESIYESIDDEKVNVSTIDRRYIALPQPPVED